MKVIKGLCTDIEIKSVRMTRRAYKLAKQLSVMVRYHHNSMRFGQKQVILCHTYRDSK